jgi:hypothetical protein
MPIRYLFTVAVLLTFASAGFAQKWEFGGAGGGAFYRNLSVTSDKGEGEAGFADGFAAGVFLGQNMYSHLGGEIRYTFERNDLQVSSGSTKFNFGGRAHALHYDFLLHATRLGSRVRPFVAAGGGVKIYEGTGKESSSQPLSSLAIPTKTRELKPLISIGGGIKFAISKHVNFRIEVRDYLTQFPTVVVTPAPNAKISGWLHNLVPMAGLSIVF